MNYKKIHIIGIGGCACSAIAEYLQSKNITITGSEYKKRGDLFYLENKGIKIFYNHDKSNLYYDIMPDLVLYSPAVTSLNPDNPELLEAKKNNIETMSWENFIGEYLRSLGMEGIVVSGSEGKGTTAGILTMILKDTALDPVSILGAKIKKINNTDSNIYMGNGNSYILEGDEYNRNFHAYHPSINITINLQFEHPETYNDFDEYEKSFITFFGGMKNEKKLIFRATENLKSLAAKYNLKKTHNIIWFDDLKGSTDYLISNHKLDQAGNHFRLAHKDRSYDFFIPSIPGYMIYHATGAIIAAHELGLDMQAIQKNIQRFRGMVRRYDLFRTKNNGIIITDYGHSPEAIHTIVAETRKIFPDKKIHLVFQPHLFSRTFNFFDEFIRELEKADRVSLVDIYPAREKESAWKDKISSVMLYDELNKKHQDVFYVGKSSEIDKTMINRIHEDEITIFIGAGDMDFYYPKILKYFDAKN